jgi:hypothetical protein
MSSRKVALVVAAGATLAIAAMVVVGVVTGASQEAHEWYAPPEIYAASLRAQGEALRLVFAIDTAFIILFTAFFVAFADYLRAIGRRFTGIALGALLVTAALDILENQHILAMLDLAQRDRPIGDGDIAVQQMISQIKFTGSYVALFLFGLAIPRTSRLATAIALYLTAGTLATAVVAFAVPADGRPAIDAMRGLSFLLGFVLVIVWLRRAPDPPATR